MRDRTLITTSVYTSVASRQLPRANQIRWEANPDICRLCPSPTFTNPPTRAKVQKSNEFVIRRESRLYSLSLLSRTVPPSVRRVPSRSERGLEAARPSLADQWKIHKLFQEKRRKSISNYSFLWRVAAGHARQGVRLMATRAHRSTSSASSSSSSASSTPSSSSFHLRLSRSPDSSVSFDAANAGILHSYLFFYDVYTHHTFHYTPTHLSSLASGWRIPVTRKISIILETFDPMRDPWSCSLFGV